MTIRFSPETNETTTACFSTEVGEREVIVDAEVSAYGVVTARGHTIAVRMPGQLVNELTELND